MEISLVTAIVSVHYETRQNQLNQDSCWWQNDSERVIEHEFKHGEVLKLSQEKLIANKL
jgi:hypothetical protein